MGRQGQLEDTDQNNTKERAAEKNKSGKTLPNIQTIYPKSHVRKLLKVRVRTNQEKSPQSSPRSDDKFTCQSGNTS